MQCADVQDELVAFHFATCGQVTREAVREHLRSCPACVQAYLDLKLDIDSAEAMAEQPSPRCHDRLRRDVQAWLLPPDIATPTPPRWQQTWQQLSGWLQQPLPRYRAALGAASLSVVCVLLLSQLALPGTPAAPAQVNVPTPQPTTIPAATRQSPDGTPLGCEFDSARMQAISITYY
jgi:anti-sigma factor RsiW